MHRRSLLKMLVLGGNAALAAVVGIPAALFALAPVWQGRETKARWRRVGRLEEFEIGAVVKAIAPIDRGDWSAALNEKSVYVWRVDDETFVVYSRNCTDLSCPIHFDSGSECFLCPCHGGVFAKDGKPLAGPPRVPLYRYANRVRNGELEIDIRSLPPMT